MFRQSGYVRNFQIGKYGKDAARILNEIAAAKICLLDPAKRAKYDAELKTRQAAANATVQPEITALPAVDLDQLAAIGKPLPLPATGGFTQSKSQRLDAPSSKRRPSAFPWYVPLGIAATLAVAGVAFLMLRPRGADRPTDDGSEDFSRVAGAIDGDPLTAATAGASQPVPVSGHPVPAGSKLAEVAERQLAPTGAVAPATPVASSANASAESPDNVAASGVRERPTGGFEAFRGLWQISYPTPATRSLKIDADGNADYSGWAFPAWQGRLRHDGDATLLVLGDASIARLRIEGTMLVVEATAASDWPGKATGIGIGVRENGTGSSQAIEPTGSRLRESGDAWADFDLRGNSITDGFARLTTTALSTKECYSGPLDATVVARTDKNNIRLHAYGVARLIFNWEVNPHELRGNTPNGADFGHAVTALMPNSWYTLRWQMTERSVQVFVDGRLVFEVYGEYDLTGANPVWIEGGVSGSTIDVKSFTVRPIPAVGVDFPGEVDGAKGGLSLPVARGFDIAKSWRLSLEFWAPKFPKDDHMIFFWGDERSAHDPIALSLDGFTLRAYAMSGDISGPVLTTRLSGADSRRWLAVRFDYDASAKEHSLFVDGKRLAREGSSIVPAVDRPMPACLCDAHGQWRFSGRVRKVRLENTRPDGNE